MASKGRTSSTKAGGGKKSSTGSSSSGSSGGSSSSGSSSSGSSSSGSSSSGSSGGSSGSRGKVHTPTPTITSVTPPTTVTSTTHTNNGISTNKTVPSANPNSKTQAGGRGTSVFSQAPTAVAQQSTSKAQKETFTYATTKSGNTFVIPSNLTAQARQYYAKLGVATSSQPPTEASFAVDSDTQVIIDHIELANWINEGVQCESHKSGTLCEDVQPVKPDDDNFTDNSIPKGDESTANGVEFGANTNGTTNTVVAEADPNWAMGQNLYTGYSQDSLAILDGSANKQDSNGQQWMTQENQNVVPRATYEQFAQNGANNTTAMVDNFKASFEKITTNKYFPFIVLGFVGLIVLSVLRGGKSSGGGSAPPVQITRYG